jgi:hypothetical protein
MSKMIQKPIKYRSKLNPSEFYWSYSAWGTKNVEGVEFVPVTKFDPSVNQNYQLHFVKKDSLEKETK